MSEHQKSTKQSYRDNYGGINWDVKPPKIAKKEFVPITRSELGFPSVSSDYEAYECPVTGEMIEGRVAHRDNLAKTGCRLHEKGEFEDCKKNGQQKMYDQIDAAVDKCVDEIAGEFV